MTLAVPPEVDPVLDNAAWSALTGRHAWLAIGGDVVRRYPDDVSPIVGIGDWRDPRVWDELVEVFGPGAEVRVSGEAPRAPEGWQVTQEGSGVQLVLTDPSTPRPTTDAVELGAADAAEMLDLVARSRPGPFLPRTYVMGRYIGIRREGRLVAMAGERLQPEGWTEISAVTTDADHRRQGLATRLVLDVAHHIRERGDRPLLHAAAGNATAIRLYQQLGFTLRRHRTFVRIRVPG